MKEFCKLIADDLDPLDGSNSFHAEKLEPAPELYDLEHIIANDRLYGKWNKDIIKFAIDNNMSHMSDSQLRKAVNWSQTPWDFAIRTKIKFVTDKIQADFTFEFKPTNADQYLTSGTLAYAGYPNGILRNVIVINSDFPYTPDGHPVSGQVLQSWGFNVQSLTNYYKTWDLDQILKHEMGHKLGLPHSPNDDRVMSSNYGIMAEILTHEEKLRIWQKYPKRRSYDKIMARLGNLIRRRQENY